MSADGSNGFGTYDPSLFGSFEVSENPATTTDAYLGALEAPLGVPPELLGQPEAAQATIDNLSHQNPEFRGDVERRLAQFVDQITVFIIEDLRAYAAAHPHSLLYEPAPITVTTEAPTTVSHGFNQPPEEANSVVDYLESQRLRVLGTEELDHVA